MDPEIRTSAPAENEPAPNESDRSQQDGWLGWLKTVIGHRNTATLRASLEDVLADEGTSGDVFSPEERAMLRNILRLREMRVEDVMVPRADIDAVEHAMPLGELLKAFRDSGHSRMPVYRDTLDDPIGMVHIKDLMAYVTVTAAAPVEGEGARRRRKQPSDLDLKQVDLARPLAELELVRPVLFVPPSMPATDLLAKMQATRTQMALVIDEYGGTDGLASLEDVVETVVGDIEDEHDDVEGPMIVAASEGVYVADARAPLEEVAEIIGVDSLVGEYGEDVDTLGGLVFTLVGRVPVRGEIIAFRDGLEFEVTDADPRRIKRLRIRRRSAVPAEQRRRRRPDNAPAGDGEAAATLADERANEPSAASAAAGEEASRATGA
ncbi:MAG: hemolysin family protein [Hyphomicrobiales bacterium]